MRLENPVSAAVAADTLHLRSEGETHAIALNEVERIEEREFKPLATFFLVLGVSLAAGALVGTPIILAN